MQDVPESLAQRHQQWIEVVNAGDAHAYAGLLAENAVWIPPGQDPLVGREAFQRWLEPFVEAFAYAFSISDARIRTAGGWAIERARFTSRMTPTGGGEPMQHTGTFTVLWSRGDDDLWYIDRYVDDTVL